MKLDFDLNLTAVVAIAVAVVTTTTAIIGFSHANDAVIAEFKSTQAVQENKIETLSRDFVTFKNSDEAFKNDMRREIGQITKDFAETKGYFTGPKRK